MASDIESSQIMDSLNEIKSDLKEIKNRMKDIDVVLTDDDLVSLKEAENDLRSGKTKRL